MEQHDAHIREWEKYLLGQEISKASARVARGVWWRNLWKSL